MENHREIFWDTYLFQFSVEIKDKLIFLQIVDIDNIDDMICSLKKQIKTELDIILSTGMVWIIRGDNSPVENKYDKLFSGDYQKTFDIFNKYIPYTMSHISRRLYFYRDGINRLLDRINNDWTELVDVFDLGPDKITGLNVSLGDLHGAGNQTSLITFNNKKIIYKPISLEIDIIIYDIMQEISVLVDIRDVFQRPLIINKIQYGYMSYILTINKTDDNFVINDIYKKLSFLLSMACLLGIGDMHADNILISIPYTYLLDLETAFYTSEEINDYSIYDNDINPVSRSGMLLDVYDIAPVVGLRTGIQGGEFPINARTIPRILHDGTDEITIKYIRDIPANDIFHHNRLYRTNGEIISIFVEEDNFISSFSEFYSLLLNERENIKNLVINKMAHRDFISRRIFIPTSMYRNFISIQEHIESGINTDHNYWFNMLLQLSKLRKTEHQHLITFIRENELLDLNEGLIPYFYRKNGDNCLYHISGAIMATAYEKTIEQELIFHIDNLPPVDKLVSYIKRSYDSVRNLKTHDDLMSILEYHHNKQKIASENNNLSTIHSHRDFK